MTTHSPHSNGILRRLPPKELHTIFPKLEFTKLPLHAVLNEAAKPIKYGYFMSSGLASILTVLRHGKIVEVGLTGAEGFVGLPLVAGLKSGAARVIVQIDGSAFRIRAKDLASASENCPELQRSLQRYAQEVAAQAGQIAACNRLHNANQRLARWLLMSQDRLGGDLVRLTQEFLAHMLGMRRASVNVAIGFLQRAGLIKFVRGAVMIQNRPGLEAAACECYAAIMQNRERWQKES